MKLANLFSLTLLVAALLPAAPAQIPNLLDATVNVNGVEIPFRFEISQKNGTIAVAFLNGEERVWSTSGKLEEGALTLDFAHLASRLEAKWDGTTLTGTFGRIGRTPYALSAKGHTPPPGTEDSDAPSIAGQWEIAVKSSKGEEAWKFLVRQSGAEVAASILRVDGDTGTLEGRFQKGKFVLSHFSGGRPALIEITPNPDGTLALLQNGKTVYPAVRSTEARAKGLPEPADPSRWTSVANPAEPLRFSAPDLNGNTVSSTDARFRGKVVLLNITGSWCPNCHDEAPYLAETYRKYRDQGLEIVALSFEEAEQLKDSVRLRAFIKNYGITYTVLLGGETGELKDKLPQAVNLNTWPATFFIGRDGLVRGVHAGFASKATGDEHEKLKAEFQHKIESLLAENLKSSR